MPAAEVLAVLDVLTAAGCGTWIGGGWGVDALAGRQTRSHQDLDLLVMADCLDAALRALHERGYAVETDWLPVRVEVVADGRGRVDLHPVTFDSDGDGHQAGLDGASFLYPRQDLVTGTIDGRRVPCVSVDLQLNVHRGYELREVDRADLEVLRRLAGE